MRVAEIVDALKKAILMQCAEGILRLGRIYSAMFYSLTVGYVRLISLVWEIYVDMLKQAAVV